MGATTETARSVAEQVDEWIRRHRSEMAAFIVRLVRMASENPPGRSREECIEVLSAEMRRLGFSPERVTGTDVVQATYGDPSPEREGLGVSDASGTSDASTASGTLYFHGHYDVVPAFNADQFLGAMEGDDIIGRGTADMKGGLAAMLYAMAALDACGARLGGRITMVCVPDEETGGADGSRRLADAGLLGRDGIGMLTAEPTSGVVWNASRGALTQRLTVRGKPAHVGQHFYGVNAFEGMVDLVQELRALARDVATRRTAFAVTPEDARSSILLLGGRVEGGANFNVVPDTMSFTLDRRFNPEETLAAERERLNAAIERARRRGIVVDVETLQEGDASATSENERLGRVVSDVVREVTGAAPRFEMCPGLLETRFYAARGIPAFAYGPGLFELAHSPEERVSVSRVATYAAIYARCALRIFSASDVAS